jgi:hypothetical protein
MNLVKKRYEMVKRDKEVFWNPETGDKLQGTVLQIDAYKTKLGLSTLIKIQAIDRIALLFAGAILRKAISKNTFKEGDSIAITYKGIPSGKKYKNYSIRKVVAV